MGLYIEVSEGPGDMATGFSHSELSERENKIEDYCEIIRSG